MILTIINWIVLYLLGGFITLCVTIKLDQVETYSGEDEVGCIIMALWPFYALLYLLPIIGKKFGAFFYKLARKVIKR